MKNRPLSTDMARRIRLAVCVVHGRCEYPSQRRVLVALGRSPLGQLTRAENDARREQMKMLGVQPIDPPKVKYAQ